MDSGTTSYSIEFAKIALSPVLAAFTAIWMFKRQQREQVFCSVGWDMFTSGREAEIPYLAVQNRSDHTIMIKAFVYRTGLFRRPVLQKIAIYWEDPFDVHFPMAVESGEARKFRLDHREATIIARESGRVANVLHRLFGLPRLRVEVRTMAGAGASAPLEEIILG